METGQGLAIDWGGSRIRLRKFAEGDRGVSQVDYAEHTLSLQEAHEMGFEAAIQMVLSKLAHEERVPTVASGMITSRGGWRETPYLDCPVDLQQLAHGLVQHHTGFGCALSLVPGIRCPAHGFTGWDVIRGEETQVLGALSRASAPPARSLWLVPGTHSKWIHCEGAKIQGFCTFVTGELFGLVQRHASFGERPRSRTSQGPGNHPLATPDFERGFRAAVDDARRDPQLLLHGLFAPRCHALANHEVTEFRRGYSSGRLIAAEIQAARPFIDQTGVVELLSDGSLSTLYAAALKELGTNVNVHDPAAHMHGIAQLIKLCPTF